MPWQHYTSVLQSLLQQNAVCPTHWYQTGAKLTFPSASAALYLSESVCLHCYHKHTNKFDVSTEASQRRLCSISATGQTCVTWGEQTCSVTVWWMKTDLCSTIKTLLDAGCQCYLCAKVMTLHTIILQTLTVNTVESAAEFWDVWDVSKNTACQGAAWKGAKIYCSRL